jgi:hypothetical protein
MNWWDEGIKACEFANNSYCVQHFCPASMRRSFSGCKHWCFLFLFIKMHVRDILHTILNATLPLVLL